MWLSKFHKKIDSDLNRNRREMKEFREEISEAESKFKVMFEMVPASVFLETLDGRIVDCNKEASKMSGYSKTELRKMTAADLVPSDVAKSFPKLIEAELKKGGFHRRTYNRRKNGSLYPVDVIGKIITIKGRKYVIVIVADLTVQVAVEEAARESEERFKLIFDLAPDAYYLTDLKGKFVEGNRAAEELIGHNKFDLLGKDWASVGLLKKADIPRALNLLRKNLAGKSTGPDEFALTRKDGREIVVEISTHPVRIKSEYLILGIARDVTERKKMEEELRLREAKLFNTVNNTPNVVIISYDDAGRILSWNTAAELIYGWRSRQACGKTADKIFLDKEGFSTFLKQVNEIKETNKPLAPFEIIAYDKNLNVHIMLTTVFAIQVAGGVEFVSISVDITERKRAEDELKRRNIELEKTQSNLKKSFEDVKNGKKMLEVLAKDLAKFKLAVEGASDHIVITDIDANIIFANKAVEATTGYSTKEIIGKNPGKLWGGQMNKEFFKKMWKTIKIDKNIYMGELKNKRKNGELYDAEVHVSPILDKDGNVVFFVGIERDVSKAKEVDRMKSEFVTVASHQLRTPLTAVKWYTELLLSAGNSLRAKEMKYVHKIYDSNQKMIRLVNDLLSISRIEAKHKFVIDKHSVDLSGLLNRVIADQGVAAEQANVKIETMNIPKKFLVMIDDEQMYQVFQNLIHNAVIYSSPGGKVVVGFESKDGRVVVFVRDFGIGIPIRQHGRVFEKFFRGENVAESGKAGTGLGLYIAKAIVEGHGGRIWFDSAEDKGTTFYIEFPKNNRHKN